MSMVIQQYAPLARRTLKELPYHQHLVHMGLGLDGEVGELLDAIKKHIIYGKPLDLVNLTEELGDSFWYAANLLPELRVSPDVFQNAMRAGEMSGQNRRKEIEAEVSPEDTMFIVSMELLHLASAGALGVARGLMGQQLLAAQPPDAGAADASSLAAVQVIQSIAGVLGTMAGLLGLSTGEAMRLNINKLAKRYGDKFSDIAALNRDLDGERAVLEDKPALVVVGGTEAAPRGEPFGVVAATVASAHDGTGAVEGPEGGQ